MRTAVKLPASVILTSVLLMWSTMRIHGTYPLKRLELGKHLKPLGFKIEMKIKVVL